MTDLWKCLEENIKEATNLLKRHNQVVEFNSDNDDENSDVPYVLITDRYDMINDMEVSKVRLDTRNQIEIYITEWEEWVYIDYCLSATANNVCMAINNKLNN